MSLLRRLFGGVQGARGRAEVDALHLEILMDYNLKEGSGRAALHWTDPHNGGPMIQAQLIALLYGRILCVHEETRINLFYRVGLKAFKVAVSGGATEMEPEPWSLRVDNRDLSLWPWALVDANQLDNPKRYRATLKGITLAANAPVIKHIHLDMAFGLERVLAPSSVLIAMSAFSRHCGQEARHFLALLLIQMNSYWGDPDGVTVGSETHAYAAAEAAIRTAQE
jgi:hypothetical protein